MHSIIRGRRIVGQTFGSAAQIIAVSLWLTHRQPKGNVSALVLRTSIRRLLHTKAALPPTKMAGSPETPRGVFTERRNFTHAFEVTIGGDPDQT